METAMRYVAVVACVVTVFKVAHANGPPTLTNVRQHLVVPEDTPIGTVLTTLTARDVDGPSPVTFDTASPESGHLARLSPSRPAGAHTWSADVILKAKLDSDFEPTQRILHFKVSDGQIEVSVAISLFISDVNDCAPQFQNLPGTITPKESTGVGSSVFQVTATDPDRGSGGAISFSLENDFNQTFSLDRYDGRLLLRKALDYETKNLYLLRIKATDGGGLSSQAELRVAVTDVQDSPPFFLRNAYSASVLENSPVGTSIAKVTAYDGDIGIGNPVRYRISSDSCDGLFSVDADGGTVAVSAALDREDDTVQRQDGVCVLNITAQELSRQMSRAEAWVSMRVAVLDVNDNKPLFSSSSLVAWTARHVVDNTPLTFQSPFSLSVQDKDKGENGVLELSARTLAVLHDDMFDLVPTEVHGQAQILLHVHNATALRNYPHGRLSIKVQAREKYTGEHFSSTATIEVKVDDVGCVGPTPTPTPTPTPSPSAAASPQG